MLKRIRGMEEFCDVTLVSDDNERVRVHKVVLASASTIFRDLFQNNEEEDEYQVIHIKGVHSNFLRAMMDLIYMGETKVEERECEGFLNLLRQYKILKYNPNGKRSNTKCKYYNRGFCKFGVDCAFDHQKGDCENHMAGYHCIESACAKRHRQICKFWDSRKGCFRKADCQYLHEDPKTKNSKTRKALKEKCDACMFNCYDKDQVIVHTIKKHKFQLCLQCDYTIKNKEVLLSKTFSLRKILQLEYPDITNKDLDRLVNY